MALVNLFRRIFMDEFTINQYVDGPLSVSELSIPILYGEENVPVLKPLYQNLLIRGVEPNLTRTERTELLRIGVAPKRIIMHAAGTKESVDEVLEWLSYAIKTGNTHFAQYEDESFQRTKWTKYKVHKISEKYHIYRFRPEITTPSNTRSVSVDLYLYRA